jgi:hypothetical protein
MKLREVFAETPMGSFGDRTDAIYPAAWASLPLAGLRYLIVV